ncbi:uncharacterized protein LOC123313888 [Coccinella septempunctata]|uniref:uncharacterized protein LOC123313888 n=1 Tax=Coccinella septempunctata TaxID=41139 RepID=UPI001D077E17|nr:uncharacterized protein LOC123313888 [Coccinella septempunctata]XP_044754917.1 uncharacterized protein LOC123313888 [Coccinella septempunctata]XP_044754918.1 uncharacterized protein LOC123313888 [Coccinella septempunctata]
MNQWFHFGPTVALLLTWCFQTTATFKQQGACYFPEKWEGTWFQSGIRQPVIIESSRISSKGRCLGSEGDKFLVVDDKRACYRCVVIHEKHANVLQYKETYCYGRDSLPSLCSYITGDALLFSMFRENATPVPCPFKAPFTFTYNRGHGECRSPVSNIDSCTEDTKLLLSYQSCPDVPGTESAVEELQCLAAWKEGSSRYLVGKVDHIHALSNEDRYRCFVYEKVTPESMEDVDYRVAQSGDATCNGLFSATEGSRTMILRKAPSLNKCHFPPWMTNYNHWHSLDYSTTYSFHHRDATLRIGNSTSGTEMRVLCTHVKYTSRNESAVVLLTHFTMGCQSGYMCMSFNRRDAHVMEVQIGSQTKRLEDACSATNFNISSQSYVTLVTTTPERRSCPFMGKFEVESLMRIDRLLHSKPYQPMDSRYFDNYFLKKKQQNAVDFQHRRSKRLDQDPDCDSDGFTNLIIGCSSLDTMEFKTDCSSAISTREYACHGRWEENGTNYLITSPVSTKLSYNSRRYCFVYKEVSPGTIFFSTSSSNCDRSIRPGLNGELIFNITSIGKCIMASGTTRSSAKLHNLGVFYIISISIMIYVQR